jgi:hypothetical protein
MKEHFEEVDGVPADSTPVPKDAGVARSPVPYALAVQRLPFTIRVAADETALLKAVEVRRSAYSRHLPELAMRMSEPDLADRAAGTAILLAESKLDGAPLGTMRIQTNRFGPLAVEQSVILPPWLKGRRLAEATRLGVAGGQIGRVVKTLLFKALFLYCQQREIDYMVITARGPLDREYEAMLFEDVFPEQGYIPMQHVGNVPHRVLAGQVMAAEARWQAIGHPLFTLVFQTSHPDIGRLDLDLSFTQDPVGFDEQRYRM